MISSVFIIILSFSLIPLSKTEIVKLDFQILRYVNNEGRLHNGDCCSGYKSTLGSGICRGGNSTCNSEITICITSSSSPSLSSTSSSSSLSSSSLIAKTSLANTIHSSHLLIHRSSKIKNLFTRIFNTLYNNQHDKFMQNLKTSSSSPSFLSSSSPIKCSIVSWKKLLSKNNLSNFTTKLSLNTQTIEIFIIINVKHKSLYNNTQDKLIINTNDKFNLSLNKLNTWTEKSYKSPNGIILDYRWSISKLSTNLSDDIICPYGYKGDKCNKPICSDICDSVHGYCEEPDTCKCKFGWAGETCSMCLPMPGCLHGTCVKPFECRCEEGWSGMFCDKPTCKTGCDPQNGYCEHPGECRCRFGYKGINCTECSTMPGCQHGSCNRPLDCNCFNGWDGMFCNVPICSANCSTEHGWCRRPDQCICRLGWSGKNCDECVPYPGCEHGTCDNPWTCNCESGWGGLLCNEKLDTCERRKPNCNGGTCISIEKADGGYICQCPPGYKGKHCQEIAN